MVQSFESNVGRKLCRDNCKDWNFYAFNEYSMCRKMGIITATCSSWSWEAKQNRSLCTALSFLQHLLLQRCHKGQRDLGTEIWKGKGYSSARAPLSFISLKRSEESVHVCKHSLYISAHICISWKTNTFNEAFVYTDLYFKFHFLYL